MEPYHIGKNRKLTFKDLVDMYNKSNDINIFCKYFPKTKEELQDIIIDHLKNGQSDLNDIDTSKITDMSELFYKINKIINLPNDLDISRWNVSNVEDMRYMFYGCENFNSDLSSWNVSNVKDMNYMFYGCKKFNSDLSKWDVSNVEDMSHMFDMCENFKSDLSSWDVSNVKDMRYMFYGCKKFNSDLSSWDVSNVENMKGMFCICKTFNSDLSSWDVSNVKDMRYMFYGCENFKSDLSSWNVSNVENMEGIFYECKNFNADLSYWDVSNVKDMNSMFSGCENFNSYLSSRDVSKVIDKNFMFDECTKFNSDLSHIFTECFFKSSRDIISYIINEIPVFIVESSMAGKYVDIPGCDCSVRVPEDKYYKIDIDNFDIQKWLNEKEANIDKEEKENNQKKNQISRLVDMLGVYIYSNNNDVMPRRIFIWIDKIAEIAKEMTTTKGKTDVTDNINALFSFVLYHEFGHAVMDIELYGVKPSQNFSYNEDVPYRYIEEICADSFALRYMKEHKYSKKQQSFIEDFIKLDNFEPLIIQRVSKWIGHWMCIKVLFDYDIAKRIENSWEDIRKGFIDFGYIISIGMKGWIVKVYRNDRLCIMDTYSRKLFDIPESNDGTYTVEYIFHYMKESSM